MVKDEIPDFIGDEMGAFADLEDDNFGGMEPLDDVGFLDGGLGDLGLDMPIMDPVSMNLDNEFDQGPPIDSNFD